MKHLSIKFITGCKYCIVCLITIMTSQSVFAQIQTTDTSGPFFGNQANGKWLIGVKAGKIDNNAEDIDDADAIGIVLGYEFAKPVGLGGTSTIELEYISGDDTDVFGGLASYEAEMLNLFLTYRSPGTLYYKFKLGLSYSNIDVDGLLSNNNPPTLFDTNTAPGNDLGQFNEIPFFDVNSDEDVSIAAGIGLGFRIQDYGSIEIEYIGDTGDNDLSLTTISAIGRF